MKWRWILYPWALAEDIGSFIRAMEPRPATPAELERRLAAGYGIRLPRKLLADLLAVAG